MHRKGFCLEGYRVTFLVNLGDRLQKKGEWPRNTGGVTDDGNLLKTYKKLKLVSGLFKTCNSYLFKKFKN